MDAQHLDLPEAQFDGVRAERLLQHVPDPEAALSEMVRIAKPGGRIVLWEADLNLLVLDAPDYHMSQAMQRLICESFHNGGIGHELYRHFQHLGLTEVLATPLVYEVTDLALIENAFDLSAMTRRAIAAGIITQQRATDWRDSLTAAHAAGWFYCIVGGVLACGRKPGKERK